MYASFRDHPRCYPDYLRRNGTSMLLGQDGPIPITRTNPGSPIFALLDFAPQYSDKLDVSESSRNDNNGQGELSRLSLDRPVKGHRAPPKITTLAILLSNLPALNLFSTLFAQTFTSKLPGNIGSISHRLGDPPSTASQVTTKATGHCGHLSPSRPAEL